ncbi:Rab32 [Thecamonas trahens ATCC 50062]|uniref:Ras-related protein Rab n=1 Tax=Thecamonas trahens ATCC 50062 TaxID=461836 RepID=A0A0L0D568_THETB|nr:Rab32 [Thecamonas trahens ATCC 50062]KNC47211.1 Rab32 [Thecamonas trahens ATCC 50062]|eukprot:XP_013759980.1 Rab32 [Thecamonas trahens ATCC 50062]
MADSEVNEHLFKVLVVGDASVGKTSIIKRFVHGIFSSNYKATIGVDFALKVVQWDDNTVVRLQLWDIAGQERYGNMTRVYFRESVGGFVVFDVTARKSFEAVERWLSDLVEKVRLPSGEPIPIVLLANKVDLLDDEGEAFMKDEELAELVGRFGITAVFATSAKQDIGINEASSALIEAILENERAGQMATAKEEEAVTVSGNDPAPAKKGCC